jgi:hypothetical protein
MMTVTRPHPRDKTIRRFKEERPMKRTRNIGIMMTLILMMIMFFVTSAFGAAAWKAKTTRFAATAGELLATGNVVCISPSDGKAYKVDMTSSTLRPAVGAIGKGGAAAATVEIVVEGIITGMTPASPGSRLYASGGGFTTTAPTYPQIMGWVMPGAANAATSTTYYVKTFPAASPGAGY